MRRLIKLWIFKSVMRVCKRYSTLYRIEFRPFSYFLCGLLAWLDGSAADVFSILFLDLLGSFKNLLINIFTITRRIYHQVLLHLFPNMFPINLPH
jgi:hypothetical protein